MGNACCKFLGRSQTYDPGNTKNNARPNNHASPSSKKNRNSKSARYEIPDRGMMNDAFIDNLDCSDLPEGQELEGLGYEEMNGGPEERRIVLSKGAEHERAVDVPGETSVPNVKKQPNQKPTNLPDQTPLNGGFVNEAYRVDEQKDRQSQASTASVQSEGAASTQQSNPPNTQTFHVSLQPQGDALSVSSDMEECTPNQIQVQADVVNTHTPSPVHVEHRKAPAVELQSENVETVDTDDIGLDFDIGKSAVAFTKLQGKDSSPVNQQPEPLTKGQPDHFSDSDSDIGPDDIGIKFNAADVHSEKIVLHPNQLRPKDEKPKTFQVKLNASSHTENEEDTFATNAPVDGMDINETPIDNDLVASSIARKLLRSQDSWVDSSDSDGSTHGEERSYPRLEVITTDEQQEVQDLTKPAENEVKTEDGALHAMSSEEQFRSQFESDPHAPEENRDLSEIQMEIESIQETLLNDMLSNKDMDAVSGNIVENLDEISALREQAEVEMPVSDCQEWLDENPETAEDDEDVEFDSVESVTEWYKVRVDELNDAAGEQLLELCMMGKVTTDKVLDVFGDHEHAQTYLLCKMIVAKSKLGNKEDKVDHTDNAYSEIEMANSMTMDRESVVTAIEKQESVKQNQAQDEKLDSAASTSASDGQIEHADIVVVVKDTDKETNSQINPSSVFPEEDIWEKIEHEPKLVDSDIPSKAVDISLAEITANKQQQRSTEKAGVKPGGMYGFSDSDNSEDEEIARTTSAAVVAQVNVNGELPHRNTEEAYFNVLESPPNVYDQPIVSPTMAVLQSEPPFNVLATPPPAAEVRSHAEENVFNVLETPPAWKVQKPSPFSSDREDNDDDDDGHHVTLAMKMSPLNLLESQPQSNEITQDVSPNLERQPVILSKETGELYPPRSKTEAPVRNNSVSKASAQGMYSRLSESDNSESDTEKLLQQAEKLEQQYTVAKVTIVTSQTSAAAANGHRENDDAGSQSDTDTEGVLEMYDAMLDEYGYDDEGPDSDSDDTIQENLDDAELIGENMDEYEAKQELRETLKDDIYNNINSMTANDFKNLMTIYRQERKSIKQVRDGERDRLNQSLWEALKHKKKDGHYGPDGHSIPTQTPNPVTKSTSVEVDDENTSEDASEISIRSLLDRETEESWNNNEETAQEIEMLDMEFVEKVSKADPSEAEKLVRQHMKNVEVLRRERGITMADHQQRIQEKLKRLKPELKDEDLAAAESEDDDQLGKELNELDQVYTDRLGKLIRKAGVGEEDFHELMLEYRENQQELIREREAVKREYTEKLAEALKKKRKSEKPPSLLESSRSMSTSNPAMQQAVEKFDEEFYADLLARHQKGDIDEEEMGYLIDEHINKVSKFKKTLREKLAKRQMQRKSELTESVKMRHADDLIQEERKEADLIKQMRRGEQDILDKKLEQKLREKKKHDMVKPPTFDNDDEDSDDDEYVL